MPLLARRLYAFMLVILVTICLAAPAYANGGPPRYVGDEGGTLLLGKSDQVHVQSERLTFAFTEDELQRAEVTAAYVMENRGAAFTDQEVLFVVKVTGMPERGMAITYKGQPLTVHELPPGTVTPEERAAWGDAPKWLDPVTGEHVDAGTAFGGTGYRFFRFALSMAGGEVGELTVKYNHMAGFDKLPYSYPVYHYQYLLSPARAWASFGPLTIRVERLSPKTAYFANNLGLTYADGAYEARFDGLPQENLSFAVMSKRGIIFGMTRREPYLLIAAIVAVTLSVLIGRGMGSLTGRDRSRIRGVILAFLAGLVLSGVGALVGFIGSVAFMPPAQTGSIEVAIFSVLVMVIGALVGLIVALVKRANVYRSLYSEGE
jgi:hypothetical protein